MNASEKRTIVVTGGAGSFGRVLVPYLVVRGFGRRWPGRLA